MQGSTVLSLEEDCARVQIFIFLLLIFFSLSFVSERDFNCMSLGLAVSPESRHIKYEQKRCCVLLTHVLAAGVEDFIFIIVNIPKRL